MKAGQGRVWRYFPLLGWPQHHQPTWEKAGLESPASHGPLARLPLRTGSGEGLPPQIFPVNSSLRESRWCRLPSTSSTAISASSGLRWSRGQRRREGVPGRRAGLVYKVLEAQERGDAGGLAQLRRPRARMQRQKREDAGSLGCTAREFGNPPEDGRKPQDDHYWGGP